MTSKRIGVYDSGVGGLTVLNELLDQYPQHSYFYFGDTAHVPYGSKSVAQIQALARAAAKKFETQNLDLLIVACNTVSCLAIPDLQAALPGLKVVGVVEAGVQSVLSEVGTRKNALILGTQATIDSQVYRKLLAQKAVDLVVYEQACPLLVPMIEGGWNDHPVLKITLQEYLSPYLTLAPGVALLACTHYPWIKKQFEAVLVGWKILNSASAVAELAQSDLGQAGAEGMPQVHYEFSDQDAVSATFLELNRVTKSHR